MSIPTFLDRAQTPDRRELWLLWLAFAFLAFSTAALILAPSARTAAWQVEEARWGALALLPAWLACVAIARWQLNQHLPERDPLLLPVGYLLAGWGVLTIWRLLPSFGWRQTGWLLAGTAVLVLIIRRETQLAWLKQYRYVWLLAGLLLTALTLLFGTHPSGGEPHLWLGWGGIYVQPSEFLRLLLIAYFASFLADRVSEAWDQNELNLRIILAPLLVMWALSIGLLFVQRDLGTGTLFIALLAVLLYLTTGRKEIILFAGVFILLAGLLASLTFGVVQARLAAWLQPWADPIGNGYQTIQALMSMAAGGVVGQGLGLGSPGFVPAAHTDFIFSSIVEEWGLIGGVAVLASLAVLIQRGFKIARGRASTFPLVLAAGLSAGMALQVLLIIGGVLRLLPLTGITVPFVSYGGSSLVTSFASLALLLKVSEARPGVNRYRPRLDRLQTGWLMGVALLALALGWWTVIQAPALRQRTDNPRRNLAARYSPRGSIYDRSDGLLAESVGAPAELERTYPAKQAVPVVGFSSELYGQAGVEAQLDLLLRGEQGYSPWTVWWHRLLRGTPPAGYDLRLTLSLPLQQAAMEALDGEAGAVVILSGTSGEILALASAPSYDPGRLEEQWQQLVSDPSSPLLNRAAQATYQPGVGLAPLLFAWGLDQGIPAVGQSPALAEPVRIDGQLLSCAWPISDRNLDTLESALRFGCPAPWGGIAQQLGTQSMVDFVEAFGLGTRLAVPLDQSETWQGTINSNPESLAQFGYGQGELTLNPLQLARAFASLAAGDGSLPGVSLLDATREPGGSWQAVEPNGELKRAVSAESARRTREALTQNGMIEFAADAIAGEAGQQLGWWMGADSAGELQPVIVIALEGESAMSARALGISLYQRIQGLVP